MITFTRGKLSKMSGVHIETIRFYENEGVLPEPKRAHNGYRLYDKNMYSCYPLSLKQES
ncbi:MerR family DNA-binding transcriptional regulator [Bacillus sp. B6(2022)]|nr:MerR family DNA-binding transcriptional regulator [Bacillus sp. B6(2022)]